MSWLREFENPIVVDGETLLTLLDAGDYIAAMPDAVTAQPHWRNALRELLSAAQRGGLVWLAEVEVRRAIGIAASERVSPEGSEPTANKILR